MRKYLLIVPAVLFPYISFGVFWHLDGEKYGLSGLVLGIILAFLACFACALVFSVICVKRQVGSDQIMNTARIIKLIHIPSYLLVFICGFLSLGMAATMIMFPIGAASLLICWFLDVLCIIVSGMVSSVAYYRAWREEKIILARALISAILSFVFCIDVIVAIIGFAGAKKK